MSEEAWPTPQSPSREPLPRVEDLPVAEQGYEQESVRAAFDSFYRHAAQLDAALRTLEAVDSFHRQAAALRADLRALRASGWTQQPWSPTPAYPYATRSPREGISPAVWRITGEVVFLIVVSVILGVAKLPWWVIVLVMAAAFLIIVVLEWSASRESFTPVRAPEPVHPVVDAQPAPEQTDEVDALGWVAFEEAQEPSDAMTIIGSAPPFEADAGPSEAHDELEAGAERAPERGAEPEEPESPDESEHRPAAVDGAVLDPWEQGFDDTAEELADNVGEPDEQTGEDEPAFAAEPQPRARRLFRRR